MYILRVLLSQLESSTLFHVQFYLLLLICLQICQEAVKEIWYLHLFKKVP